MSGDLAWVLVNGRPVAQKWPADDPYTAGKPDIVKEGGPLLARHKLAAKEWGLPIAELERRYPAPAKP